ncbi:MAG: M48 family metalloprotease [Acidobacteria bacterium]|nr:M48 family metalloprotease [Acidobacteriota bacterium]
MLGLPALLRVPCLFRLPRLARLPTRLLAAGLVLSGAAHGQEVVNSNIFFKSAEAARQAVDHYGTYDNREELERIQDIGYRLAQESSFTDYPFSFYLVDMPIPNAFALPGGQVFVTRGMLDLGLTDDMLAGLLGHEIGHVVLQHGTKMKKRATLLNVLSQALLVGVIVSTRDSDRDPGPAPVPYGTRSEGADRVMGAAAAGIVFSELLLRGYSREFEDQADDAGVRLTAEAGFEPGGFGALMSLMNIRLPQSKEYGYWSTHPFFDSRLRAALVREDLLSKQESTPADAYRRKTQASLLTLAREKESKKDRESKKPGEEPDEMIEFLQDSAVTAWPRSTEAHAIRLERLQAGLDQELENNRLSRDYGQLISLYRSELERVEALDPQSPHAVQLREALTGFDETVAEIYPIAVEVFRRGIYETDFLETFVSNYPDADELAEVSLALGEAYSRLRRPEDAVSMLLRAWREAPESEAGERAKRGLLILTPTLQKLGALQELASQAEDPKLKALALDRLAESIGTFEALSNGAEFLEKYPESEFSEAVNERLDKLAEDLYGEALLYQRIGDQAKALERIQNILTNAPLSPVASRLRASAVLES